MKFILETIVLGILQGLTEFLPVSSSGHLALAEHFLKMKMPGVFLEVMLHAGTLGAVLIYFRKDIWSLITAFFKWAAITVGIGGKNPAEEGGEAAARFEEDKRLILCIIIGTIPAGLLGLLAKDWLEGLFSRIDMVGGALMATAVFLLIGETLATSREDSPQNPGILKSIIIGIAQAVAIIPGISRSGSTVSAGLLLGLKPEAAVRFSFLLSIPAVAGALVLEIKDVQTMSMSEVGGYIVGPLVALAVGYLAIGLFLEAARRVKLRWFALYCFLLGASVVVFSFAGK